MKPNQKRTPDGKYDHDGDLNRMCVCGHTFGDHSSGSPADCLAYSLHGASEFDKACRCLKFRPVKTKKKSQ